MSSGSELVNKHSPYLESADHVIWGPNAIVERHLYSIGGRDLIQGEFPIPSEHLYTVTCCTSRNIQNR